MTYFHIRLSSQIFVKCEKTLKDEFNPAVHQFAENHLCEYIIALENADEDVKTTHIHIHGKSTLYDNTVAPAQSLRRSWESAGLPMGRGVYTIKSRDNVSGFRDPLTKKIPKTVDAEGYVYVCKGPESWIKSNPRILASKGFSEEQIDEFHEQYWLNNKGYQDQLRREKQPEPIKVDMEQAPEVKRRKKVITWTQAIINEINNIYPDKTWDKTDRDQKIFLCDIILDRMGSGGKALDNFIFIRTFNAVYNGIRKSNKSKTDFRQGYYDLV